MMHKSPCEDNQKAFIMRFYEAEGTYAHTKVNLGFVPESLEITNMLEETMENLPSSQEIKLTFRPFEIKTLKIGY